ncbi:hypothetical protein ymoll0001_8330 [Yersinia mollaretii ATCC 43969]|uniref:Uncharacterized protein n=1 Tax=Yersinia mollaretii (strain ATCC 43969 / DSM 18520 / CIP 103324 / CNY 7263 / WAIP 204) TaxID=349967 RepID=A0ABP2EEM1_YERMW|nr:hypothetical protein ymoll0001_8330 [Yersinia mollaretii ATCC 43969]
MKLIDKLILPQVIILIMKKNNLFIASNLQYYLLGSLLMVYLHFKHECFVIINNHGKSY